MTFRLFKLVSAVRAYLAHGSFVGATALDAVGVERFRPLVLALYLAAFLVDHVGA